MEGGCRGQKYPVIACHQWLDEQGGTGVPSKGDNWWTGGGLKDPSKRWLKGILGKGVFGGNWLLNSLCDWSIDLGRPLRRPPCSTIWLVHYMWEPITDKILNMCYLIGPDQCYIKGSSPSIPLSTGKSPKNPNFAENCHKNVDFRKITTWHTPF